MTPKEFCYWLQGYFELNTEGWSGLTENQVKVVKNHLDLVFNKVTPDEGDGQNILNEILEKSPNGKVYC